MINPLTGRTINNNSKLGRKIRSVGADHPDIQNFLYSIPRREYIKLAYLLKTKQKKLAIELTCAFITSYFQHIPNIYCTKYGFIT